MTTAAKQLVQAGVLVVLGLAIAVMGVYVGSTDDAPGGALIGLVLFLAAFVLAVETARDRLPAWAVHTALLLGIALALFAAWLTVAVAARP